MEKLVSAYLDDDVPKEIYLAKKDTLMRSLTALRAELKDFERGRKNRVEPLREWILDMKQADFLSRSDDLRQIKSFVQKIGTNPSVRDKSPHFGFPPPSQFAASRRHFLPTHSAAPRSGAALTELEVSICGLTGNRTRALAMRPIRNFGPGGNRTRACTMRMYRYTT